MNKIIPILFYLLFLENLNFCAKVFIAYPSNYTGFFVILDPTKTYHNGVTYSLPSNSTSPNIMLRKENGIVSQYPLANGVPQNTATASQNSVIPELGFAGPIFYMEDWIWRQKAKMMTFAYANECNDQNNLIYEIFYEECYSNSPDSSSYRVMCDDERIRLYLTYEKNCASVYNFEVYTKLSVDSCYGANKDFKALSKCLNKSVLPLNYIYYPYRYANPSQPQDRAPASPPNPNQPQPPQPTEPLIPANSTRID